MTLQLLASEIIGDIASLVDGEDVLRLLLIGNRALSSKICHSSIETVNCAVERFARFPSIIYSLLGMRNLVIRTDCTNGFPLKLPVPPTGPLPHLVTLEFRFAQSFAILDGPIQLKALLPQLQRLTLADSTVFLRESHLQGLPEGLLNLQLTLPDRSHGDHPPISFSVLQKCLPKTLEGVFLHTCVSNPENISAPIWPPSIRELAVFSVQDVSLIPLCLPDSLELLNIAHVVDYPDAAFSIQANQLPPNLRTLSVDLQDVFSIVVGRETPFPRSLTSIDVEIVVDDPEIDLISMFPPSLESYSSWKFSPSKFIPLLPKTWSHISATPPVAIEYLSHLPSRLQLFSLFSMPNGAPRLPFETFPSSITNLGVPEIEPSDFQYFPNLTHLHLFPDCSRLKHVSEEFFKLLPRKLVALMIHPFMIPSSQYLDHLPPNLRVLNLILPHNSVATSWTNITNDEDMPKHLPSSLQALTLMNRAFLTVHVSNWYRHMSHLTHLTTLDLDPGPRDGNNDEITFLDHVPPSLQTLTLYPTPAWELRRNCLNKLPHKLQTLTVVVDLPRSGEYIRLSDHHFHHLPASLTSLSVTNGPLITHELVPHLPPGLLVFNIGQVPASRNSLWEEAMSGYYANPLWQGSYDFK